MKLILATLLLTSFTAKASPLLSMKERLRSHLWVYGLSEDKPVKKRQPAPAKTLPEEIERPLRKI
jgi:hypothetical protein